MKRLILLLPILLNILLVHNFKIFAQSIDSLQTTKEFNELEEAFKVPEQVYRLNLSNKSMKEFPIGLSKFKNLQYLSLRNDHLKLIPEEIASLQKLKILDLGGNDFEILPIEFAKLKNLEELYLDEDKKLNLSKDFDILGKLPKLKILHLDNDNIQKLPINIQRLKHLEKLYLSNNLLHFVPKEVTGLKYLKYLDINHNPLTPNLNLYQSQESGFKIKF
jgi:Leucine-rich repeat (LRR) protein